MESDGESGAGEVSINEDKMLDYFGTSSEPRNWDERETRSLNEIVDEIFHWQPSMDGKNIFLVNSYHEKRRGMASLYIATSLEAAGMKPVLIESRRDLKVGYRDSGSDVEENSTVFFLNYSEGSKITPKNLRNIIIALGERKVRKFPVVVSVPNHIMELFESREDDIISQYPQNAVSRALLLAGMAILLMPLVDFPYTQVPIGSSSGLSDAGLILSALFIYSIVLMFSGRKSLGKREGVPMFASVALVFLSFFFQTILNMVKTVAGFSSLNSPVIDSDYFSLFPVVISLAAFSIFPLGFSRDFGKRHLLFSFVFSVVLVSATMFLMNYTFLGTFMNFPLATFGNEYLFINFFPPVAANPFMTGVLATPVSVVYFYSYYLISTEMKAKYRSLAASIKKESHVKRREGRRSGM